MGCSSSNDRFNALYLKCDKKLNQLEKLKIDIGKFDIKNPSHFHLTIQEMTKLENEIKDNDFPNLEKELNEVRKDGLNTDQLNKLKQKIADLKEKYNSIMSKDEIVNKLLATGSQGMKEIHKLIDQMP